MICGTAFLAIIGRIFLISILLSVVRCELEQPCQDCTDQHIKVIIDIPGKCDICWPCELLECQEGLGSSVACGSTVSHGTTISCVACIRRVNFSDTLDSKQCQPCGTCAGSHEHTFVKCNPKHNVKCECNEGFYRNRTTEECLPCVLCCTNDGEIAQKCRGDGGEIEMKCKFNKLWPKTCLSLSSSMNPHASKTTETHSSAVVVTSSSLMRISSVLNQTDTPLLHSMTATAPEVSKTVQSEITLSSVWPGHGIPSSILRVNIVRTSAADSTSIKEKKRDKTLKVHSHKVVSISIFLSVGLVFSLALGYTLKHMYKSKSVSQHRTEKIDSKPDTGGKTHKRFKSKVTVDGGVSPPALEIISECNIFENVDATCRTPGSSRNCSSCAHKKETGANVQIAKDHVWKATDLLKTGISGPGEKNLTSDVCDLIPLSSDKIDENRNARKQTSHKDNNQQSAIMDKARGSDVAGSLKDRTVHPSRCLTNVPSIFTHSVKINLIQTPE